MKKDSVVRPDRAATSELNHDLKIRARRRLIGAITLVLTAVIVVPMLLDSEPRPLNQNIPVEIPSKNTPFTPKLEPVKPAVIEAPASGSTKPESDEANPQKQEVSQSEPKPVRTDDGAQAKALLEGKTVSKEQQSKSEQAKSEPAKTEPAKPSAPQTGKYLIQVAAYSKEEQAQAWIKKLKAAGFQAYTEKVTTSAGVRIRVRVGPFSTQAEADKALTRIKALGGSEARLVN